MRLRPHPWDHAQAAEGGSAWQDLASGDPL